MAALISAAWASWASLPIRAALPRPVPAGRRPRWRNCRGGEDDRRATGVSVSHLALVVVVVAEDVAEDVAEGPWRRRCGAAPTWHFASTAPTRPLSGWKEDGLVYGPSFDVGTRKVRKVRSRKSQAPGGGAVASRGSILGGSLARSRGTGTRSVHACTCTPLHHSAPRNARIVRHARSSTGPHTLAANSRTPTHPPPIS